jgi:UDP-N-acetylmuramate--alanine ligase
MTKETYHFIGLGGIGMSALARILMQRGHNVQGSDASASPLLDQLQKEGAAVRIGHSAEGMQGATVVYSSAVKDLNVELLKAKELNLSLLHRSDLLDLLMKGKKPLLVTGTHGKTTTTALLAAVLIEAKSDPSFVIGGILQPDNTNGQHGSGPYFVAEADESDGSFLRTKSFGAIVTNLENDHLDYWGSEERLDEAFRQFFSQAKKPEHLFWCADDPRLYRLQPAGISYGFSEGADLCIRNYRQTGRGISFDLSFKGKEYPNIELQLLGRHNALNGAAVFGLALSLKIPEESIRLAFRYFQGTSRRLEFKGSAHRVDLYDDYGHHPTEIAATLRALRDRVREKRLVVVFQPHRYTRVRDLFDGFLCCFPDADEVILTDIYSAGEEPIEGVTTAALYARMKEKLGAKLHYLSRSHLETGVAELLQPLDVVLTIGAGDVTYAGEPILKKFADRAPKITVGVLCGGTSAEHTVSLNSGRYFARSLDPSIYQVKIFGVTKEGEWICGSDAIEKLEQKIRLSPGTAKISAQTLAELTKCGICIPVFHGPQGEDGMMQGLLDALFIPYVGCDYRAAALCMQKAWTKHIALLNNVPTAPYVEIDAASYRRNPHRLLKMIEEELTYPVWIKAVHLGSSLGVSRAASPEDVPRAAELSFSVDDALIAEQEIDGRQIEFAVIGNEYVRVAEPCEILNEGAFYDFENKYGTQAMGVAIPPNISEIEMSIGKELAEKVYRASGCKGLARVDFFLDKSGHYWLNEINPFPGCTPTSGFPKMWEASGIGAKELMDELIVLGLHRSRRLAEIRGK